MVNALNIKNSDGEWVGILTIKGDRGEPFKYSDFTSEQLANLKGEAFTFADFTSEQLALLKGEPGDTVIDFVPVDSLDEVTEPNSNKIYLVRKENGIAPSIFDEYMYIDGNFEELNSKSDLSNFYNKTEIDNKSFQDQKILVTTENYGSNLTQEQFNGFLSYDMLEMKNKVSSLEETLNEVNTLLDDMAGIIGS